MKQTTILVILVGLVIISSFSLSVQSKTETIGIKTGSYYGECAGYCKEEVEVTPKELIRTVESDKGEKYTQKTPFEIKHWRKLTKKIDWEVLETMPDIIGHPDSGDEGAEWIEITVDGKTKRVEFSVGSEVPEEISELVEMLRNLRVAAMHITL